MMTKSELRAQIAERVKQLSPAYCQAADAAICAHILGWETYRSAQTIFCYIGTAREINTAPLLQAMLDEGKTIALPICTGKGIMVAHQIRSLSDLVEGKYGILAPSPDCPVVEPEAFDLGLIPCSTGNAKGQRCGYGGGFYDRYLPKMNCPAALLCRAELSEPEIPMDPHDRIMDFFVSENGIVKCQ